MSVAFHVGIDLERPVLDTTFQVNHIVKSLRLEIDTNLSTAYAVVTNHHDLLFPVQLIKDSGNLPHGNQL